MAMTPSLNAMTRAGSRSVGPASPAGCPVTPYMSTTMSVDGRAQQISTWPSAGGSSGSGA